MSMFKKLFGTKKTKEQKLKLDSVDKALATVRQNIEKHLMADNRVLKLNDFQIIYGVAHVLFEDEVLKEINSTGVLPESITAIIPDKPSLPEYSQQKFDNVEAVNGVYKTKKTFH